MIRKIIFYKQYFIEFYTKQKPKIQEKIDFVLDLIKNIQRVPEKFLKHIEGSQGLYEIRIKIGTITLRIFCCFDKGNLVVLFNGFIKKSKKTPKTELTFALKLMKEYYDEQKK